MARSEFEVEIVFAFEGNHSPKGGHPYDEIIVVTDGVIELERSDWQEVGTYAKHKGIFLPKSTAHQITVKKALVKLVIIHPERYE